MHLSTLALLLTLTAASGSDELALDPLAARLAAAREAVLQRELGRAHDLLQAALEEAPGEPAVRLWLARVHNELGHGADAAAVLGPALAANDGSAWLWAELGRARRLAGDGAGAELALRSALERGPALGAARLELVELLVEAGRAAEAEPLLEPLLASAGDALPVVLGHAALLDALGRPDEAEARLVAALEQPAARLALARRAARAGRHDEAWTTVEPLVESTRDPGTLAFLAEIAQAAGRDVDALALLGAALTVDPTHSPSLAALNELLEHRGSELRRGLTERWVAARPDDAAAWCELLETELDAGRTDELFRALEELPQDVRRAAPVRRLEGEALRRAGRSDEARAVLVDLCADPAERRAWYELGLLEYAAGDAEAAARAFERGADGAWAPDAHFNRGICLDRLGRYAEAARAYASAIERRPDFAEAWYQLAVDQRARLGDPEGARASFQRYLELGGDDPEARRFVEEDR